MARLRAIPLYLNMFVVGVHQPFACKGWITLWRRQWRWLRGHRRAEVLRQRHAHYTRVSVKCEAFGAAAYNQVIHRHALDRGQHLAVDCIKGWCRRQLWI